MVNPLHGFISEEGQLFQEFDSEGKGINIYKARSILASVFDYVFGKAEQVSVAGDVISVDRKSAERFFDRNRDLFEGKKIQEMSLKDKLLYLLKHNNKYPCNMLSEEARGGEEAKRALIGKKQQFLRLVQALQKNAFKVTSLFEFIQDRKEPLLSIEREVIFRHIVEENRDRLGTLTSSIGDERICRLASCLIEYINKDLF